MEESAVKLLGVLGLAVWHASTVWCVRGLMGIQISCKIVCRQLRIETLVRLCSARSDALDRRLVSTQRVVIYGMLLMHLLSLVVNKRASRSSPFPPFSRPFSLLDVGANLQVSSRFFGGAVGLNFVAWLETVSGT